MSGRTERHTGKAFYDVTLDEMKNYLEPQGFQIIENTKIKEYVFGKRVDQLIGDVKRQLSLVVFTGIHRETDRSRGVGKDAIRVSLFMRDETGDVTFLGGDVRVHRIKTWATNLKKRLDKWLDLLPKDACPKCGMPLVIRETNRSGKKRQFIGCAGWKRGGQGCDFTRNV